MLADSFWTTQGAQVGLAALVGLVAFLLAWFLLGNAARARKDRDVEARMRAVIQPGQHPIAVGGAVSTGWIPAEVTRFGQRFADAQGFSERPRLNTTTPERLEAAPAPDPNDSDQMS